MTTGTRDRMVETAARVFQRDGYEATSWRKLVDEAGVPWGSMHHHFPGGKQELGVAAIEAGSDAVSALIAHCFETEPDPESAVAEWFRLSGQLLTDTGFTAGCPVATVALETASRQGPLNDASARAFARWEKEIAARLRSAGATRSSAARAATLILTLLEGGLLLARTHGATRSLSIAGAQASRLASDAVRS